MVTYHFPPVGGVGVERSLKHATYLPEHGWEPVVVAPRNSGYRIVIPESVERIPPRTEVHRTTTVEPAHVRRAVARLLGRGTPAGTASTAARPPRGSDRPGGLRSVLNRAWALAVPLVLFPDEQLLWAPGAIRAGRAVHEQHPVDLIYSSSPPVSGHLAAAVLSDLLGVPWVADFRDPWMGNAFVSRMPAVHRFLQRHLERSIVVRADRVLFATSTWRDRYARRYPNHADRFLHVPNGYDPADLDVGHGPEPPEPGPRTLIYAGSIYGERELSVFLDGVALALHREPSLRDRLRVQFVGMLNPRNREVADARLDELAPIVSFLGLRPRPEVIAMERAAHAGLILIADDPGRDADVNAKLYEYIGLDLPVLAVAPPGETRSTLEELAWGIGVDPNPEAIADGILSMVALPPPNRDADPEGRYERRALTARLAGILNDVVGPGVADVADQISVGGASTDRRPTPR